MAKVEDCPGFETFGADVKAARKVRCLARKVLAEMVGIEWRYLANIENKGTIPSTETYFTLLPSIRCSRANTLLLASSETTINSFILFDTYYILCYYNLVFESLCYPEMGVWAIHPGHMLFKLENRVIIMPFFTAL